MKKDEMLSIINESLIETIEDDSIFVSSETSCSDLPAWDSISKIVFIGIIEDKLNIKLSRVDIISLNKFGDFADLLLEKVDK